jgi:hypothetical protein
MGASYWACAGITALSARISLFFVARAIGASTGLAQTNARYAAARCLPLALVSFVPFFHHSRPFLVALALVMTLIQALDAFIGVSIKDRMETLGGTSALEMVRSLADVVVRWRRGPGT